MLYDIDKDSEDRGSPTPNHDDKIIEGAIKTHKTISTHYSSDADQSNTRLQMQNKQIVGNNGTSQIVNYGVQSDGNFALKFFDANGVGVARFGQYADGSIALKVAKSGQEVDTATNDNLIFNSSQDIFKIIQSGTITSNIPGTLASNTTSTVTQAHGLGYTPAFMGFMISQTYLGSSYIQTPFTRTFNIVTGVPEPFTFYLSTDSTNIYANVYNGGGVGVDAVGTTVFKYYLLQETAS